MNETVPSRRARRSTTLPPDDHSALVRIGSRVPAELRHYLVHLARLRTGNQVRLLRAGKETYPAMLAAIAGARRQILFETYILEDDRTGERFGSLLREKAQAGLEVKLMFDSVGGLGATAEWLNALVDAGVEVVEYHPIAPWRRKWNLSRRDHRKILVVDDEVAFTGGINISDDYADVADGGKGWHDMHCEMRGPVVLDLSRMFRRTWMYAGGKRYPAPPRPDHAHPEGGMLARILENSRRRRKREIRRAYVHAINAARDTVYLENAYFLPDRPMRRALVRAAERGVDVQVIVPARSDVRAVEYAGLYVHRFLSSRGVKILRWKGVMLHAKCGVVDGVWTTIGSYNFDARSLFFNLEVVAEVLDGELGVTMQSQFVSDAIHCEVFDEARWLALPWWKKALAWIAFRMRHYL